MMGALEILKLVGIFIISPSLERCPNSYCKEISDTEICLGSVKSVDNIFQRDGTEDTEELEIHSLIFF